MFIISNNNKCCIFVIFRVETTQGGCERHTQPTQKQQTQRVVTKNNPQRTPKSIFVEEWRQENTNIQHIEKLLRMGILSELSWY